MGSGAAVGRGPDERPAEEEEEECESDADPAAAAGVVSMCAPFDCGIEQSERS